MTFRFSFLISALLVATACADAPGVNKDLSANAALYYWQAIEAMPKLEPATEKMIEAWADGPPSAEIQKVLDSHKPCLAQLHRGSKFERCEWALDYDLGISMLLQCTQETATLARRAGWSARAHFEAGRHQDGASDLIAALTAARHVGSDPILISTQVQYAMEDRILAEAAAYLPRMDAAARKDFAVRLESLPPGNSLKTALRAEKELYLGWIIKQLRAVPANQPSEFQRLLFTCFGDEDSKKQIDELAGTPPSREKVFTLLEATKPLYDEAADLTAVSWTDWPTQWRAFEQRLQQIKANNPFLEKWMLNLPLIRSREAKNRATWAMLKAALAAVQSGPEALKNHPDPYSDGPFQYRPLNPGFELQSKLQSLHNAGQERQPVVLTVGQRRAR